MGTNDALVHVTCPCGFNGQVQSAEGEDSVCPQCNEPVSSLDGPARSPSSAPSSQSGKRASRDASSQSDVTDWKVGDVLLNLYEVKEVLGRGGMGKVFRVHHRGWDVDLAVKSPSRDLLSRMGGPEKFEEECETWIGLGLHPNIVTCYYVRQIDNVPRIFSEYVDGGTLLLWLQNRALYEGGTDKSLKRVLSVAIEIAWGLAHAHQADLMHRDIKPANIMMTRTGTAKITDFGLASAEDAANAIIREYASRGASAGAMTPKFCSPEQADNVPINYKTDVWSWALVVLQMFTRAVTWHMGSDGKAAFEAYLREGPSEDYIPDMPERLAGVLGRCFQADPADRPEDMLGLATELVTVYEDIFDESFPIKQPGDLVAQADRLNNRAVSLLDLGRVRQANHVFHEALSSAANHLESVFNLGLLQWRHGKITDGAFLGKMHEVASLHAGEGLPQLLLARIHTERGDLRKAARVLDEEAPDRRHAGDIQELREYLRGQVDSARGLIRPLEGHMDRVTAVALCADDRFAATGGEDNTVRFWDVHDGRCLHTFEGHRGSVRALQLRHDARRILSGSNDGTIKIWDPEDTDSSISFDARCGVVNSLQWSRKYDIIVAAGEAKAFYVHDGASGELLAEARCHGGAIHSVALSLNRRYALTGSEDGAAKLVQMKSGDVVRVFEGHDGPVMAVALKPDGTLAVTGGADGTVRVWDVQRGRETTRFSGHAGAVSAVAINDTGTHVVSVGVDGALRMWNIAEGRCVCTFKPEQGAFHALALSPDGATALCGGDDKIARLYRIALDNDYVAAPYILCRAQSTENVVSSEAKFNETLDKARQALEQGDLPEAAERVREARALPGCARRGPALSLWFKLYTKLPRKELLGAWEASELKGHEGAVNSIAVTPDNKRILSAGGSGIIRVWDLGTGRALPSLEGHLSAVSSVVVSGDGDRAASASEDGAIKLWDLRSNRCVTTLNENGGAVTSVALSPNGAFVVTAGWEIKVWHLETGHCLHSFEGHESGVSTVVWSPDGSQLISGGADNTIKVWNLPDCSLRSTFEGHGAAVLAIDVSADGALLLSGCGHIYGKRGALSLWALPTARPIRTLVSGAPTITSVGLSLDGQYAVSGDAEGRVQLWHTQSSKCIREFEGKGERLEAVALTGDARMILAAGQEGVIRRWVLDWELEAKRFVQWDRNAKPYLKTFLAAHTPYEDVLSSEKTVSEAMAVRALTQRGKPQFSNADVERLVYRLGCVGLGWINREGVYKAVGRAPGG